MPTRFPLRRGSRWRSPGDGYRDRLVRLVDRGRPGFCVLSRITCRAGRYPADAREISRLHPDALPEAAAELTGLDRHSRECRTGGAVCRRSHTTMKVSAASAAPWRSCIDRLFKRMSAAAVPAGCVWRVIGGDRDDANLRLRFTRWVPRMFAVRPVASDSRPLRHCASRSVLPRS